VGGGGVGVLGCGGGGGGGGGGGAEGVAGETKGALNTVASSVHVSDSSQSDRVSTSPSSTNTPHMPLRAHPTTTTTTTTSSSSSESKSRRLPGGGGGHDDFSGGGEGGGERGESVEDGGLGGAQSGAAADAGAANGEYAYQDAERLYAIDDEQQEHGQDSSRYRFSNVSSRVILHSNFSSDPAVEISHLRISGSKRQTRRRTPGAVGNHSQEIILKCQVATQCAV